MTLRLAILTGVLCLAATSLPADVLDDVVYGRINSSNGFELFRNDGTTMQQAAGPNSPTPGIDDGIYGMVATADGNVVVARTYDPAGPGSGPAPGFNMLRYDVAAESIVELNRTVENPVGSGNVATVDDGRFGMVAASDGSVVMACTYDPAGPGSGPPPRV